ncbi:FecR family protein [Chitinophaga tropicalis]|uniref:DUF4974 domain-containing protein n=1 Tax=Chitinophaga tropicalis TaxID=2683588 RepID=A0A7K1U5S2_9BACT|nr:FecR domain-containing protein [Chitinophaga tropicalis]MVT09707.1 DUF4974 domain-containing protein [Chitinophaga tropicalis]
MDKGTLSSLLEKFRQGNCTKEEQELLYKWLDALEQEESIPLLTAAEKHRIKQDMQQHIWPLPRRTSRIGLRLVKAAAVIIPLIVAGYFLRQHSHQSSIKGQLALKTVCNNSGNMQKLVLPDSSVVLLGPYCTIQFPPQFPQHARPVHITEGKAFFETVTDARRPFTVEDNNGTRTTVLGTSFTVETNSTLQISRVAVATGKVKVQGTGAAPATLGPAQRLTVQGKGTTVQDSIATADLLAWTQGEIVLRNATLHELLLTIKTQYGIETTTTLDLNKGNYTLRFPASMALTEVLDIIGKISYKPKIHFTMLKDKLVVD